MATSVGGDSQRVTVTIDADTGKCTPDPFHVSKSSKQHVMWVCNDPTAEFSVEFVGETPFTGNRFHKKSPSSGAVPDHVPAGGKLYKYNLTITRAGNAKTYDPNGQVDP